MNKPFPGLGSALLLLLATLLGQIAMSVLLKLIWPHPDLVLLAGLANLAALGAAVFAAHRWGAAPLRFGTGGAGLQFWAALSLAAAGATVVLGEFANLSTAVIPLSPEMSALFNRLSDSAPAVSLFTLAIVAPLTEESLFRGVLLPGFAQRWGRWPAITLSSLLFAVFHLNLWQAPAAFVAGLFLGWLYLRTGSLLYPMVAHAAFNGLPVVLSALGLTVDGYNTPLAPGVSDSQPPLWLVAGGAVLGLGLWLAWKTAPLSPPPVSDTVQE